MKKRLFIFLFILVLAVSVIAVACNKPVEHTHSYGEWEVVTPATCTTAGSRVRTCSCGEKETQSIPATGHKFGEWTTVKEATETEEGLQERTCSVCGAKETRKIDKLPAPTEPVAKTDGKTQVALAEGTNENAKLTQYTRDIEITGILDEEANAIDLTFTYVYDNQKNQKYMFTPAVYDEGWTEIANHGNGAYFKIGTTKTYLLAAGDEAEGGLAVEQDEMRSASGALIQKASFTIESFALAINGLYFM